VKAINNYIFDLCILFGAALLLSFSLSSFNKQEISRPSNDIEIPKYNTKFGFETDVYYLDQYKLEKDQYLSDVLLYEGIEFKKIVQVETNSKSIFNIRNFKAGKSFYLIRPDTCVAPICMVYEPDKYSYVQYFFNDKATVHQVKKPVITCVEQVSGIIEGTLWDAMVEQNLSPALIDKMEDALSSSVDFYHTKVGDRFKLMYETQYVNGEKVGIGDVLGAVYKNNNGEHYAIYYENENYMGHYDTEGNPTKRKFLRAPVKYSRISSRFSYSRLHPIKKRRIPHLGTDYAAAHGTPIFAVADGIVEKASYNSGNGKYVKIKHDKIYQTQYLHMSGFAKNIKRGAAVKQGQTIGYVGSTGLATGPHVCFRFWKNGKQINHLRENFPPANPLPKDEIEEYFKFRNEIVDVLDNISYRQSNELSALVSD